MIILICKAKLLVQVVLVKYNPKAWLSIEEEIVDSMSNAGAKESVRTWYWRYKGSEDALAPSPISLGELRHGILRLVKQGYSTLQDMDDIQELYDRKEYYRVNKEEYGDYYENTIYNTENR